MSHQPAAGNSSAPICIRFDFTLRLAALSLCLMQAACGGGSPAANGSGAGGSAVQPTPVVIDRTCDDAPYPSTLWTECELKNFAKVLEAPTEQLSQPAFTGREISQSITNVSGLLARDLADPSWLLASSTPIDDLLKALLTNPTALIPSLAQLTQDLQQDPTAAISLSLSSPVTPPGATYALSFAGDPYRYPQNAGADGSTFYQSEALVTPVVFYDSDCARLSGRVWQPRSAAAGTTLPGVVLMNGSVEAPETAYWWAAQLLARNGYVVLSFDPRGQGRSDFEAPDGKQGSNVNPSVFWTGLVDAIDFFRSSPARPHPNNLSCKGTYPTAVAPYNPAYAAVDPARLGIAGHSLGAIGVSVVQSYGAAGAESWPGKLDTDNPVKVAVGWDGITTNAAFGIPGNAIGGGVLTILQQLPLTDPAVSALLLNGLPAIVPHVPTMSQDSEYGLAPTPYLVPPDPEHGVANFDGWETAGLPWFDFTIRGSTHLEWALTPAIYATSWCPDAASNQCSDGWGNAMAQHYSLAWLDRWLKKPGEAGFDDADARLLDDGGAQGGDKFSFRFHSARDFPDRGGNRQKCGDIRAGC